MSPRWTTSFRTNNISWFGTTKRYFCTCFKYT
nr:MAG TPA: hypothetical protein [Bacteriophage sp.]